MRIDSVEAIAIWDLVGKALGKSVCALLGGYRDRLPIISIGGYYMPGKTLSDIGREMARVQQATRIPITAGQCEITSHGVRRLVDAGAVDFVNSDASEGGGVTDWRRAAGLCAAAGEHRKNRRCIHICGD